MIKFEIPGQPQGKARARVGKGYSYTPEKTVLYENLIKTMYQQETDKYFKDEPIKMRITAYYETPKSWSKKKRDKALCDHIRPTVKPDVDNICKVVCDALNGVAYHDDKQVVEVTVVKVYEEKASVVVTIDEVQNVQA